MDAKIEVIEQKPKRSKKSLIPQGPRVKTISVTYNRKFNLGQYNSAEVGLTTWADVEFGLDDVDVCIETMFEQAKAHVKTQSMPILRGDACPKCQDMREKLAEMQAQLASLTGETA